MELLVSFIAKFILVFMGWNLISHDVLQKLRKSKRSVIVFSHTSYFDFYILILYLLAYPRELKSVKTLVKPQPFKHFGWILRRFGAIPATKVDDKNGGAVNRITNELKHLDSFMFLISPKGSILKREWRSGYYHIAKQLNVPLKVAGLDYETQKIIVSDEIDSNKSESDIESFLKDELKEIVPLFPKEEVVDVRPYKHTRIINKTPIIIISIVITIIYFL